MTKLPEEIQGSDLSAKTVTVMGLGSIGSAVAERLARLGVNLRIIDRDRVGKEDIHHLSLYGEEHISKFKAKEAKKLLEALNSKITVKAFHEDIVENNAYLVEADVVIECSGDLDTALLIDKAAKKSPIIYARACGVQGQIYVADETRLSEVSGFLEKQGYEKNSPILGSSSQTVAALAVNKALKILSDQKTEKNLLVIDMWKYSMDKVPVRKDKK